MQSASLGMIRSYGQLPCSIHGRELEKLTIFSESFSLPTLYHIRETFWLHWGGSSSYFSDQLIQFNSENVDLIGQDNKLGDRNILFNMRS